MVWRAVCCPLGDCGLTSVGKKVIDSSNLIAREASVGPTVHALIVAYLATTLLYPVRTLTIRLGPTGRISTSRCVRTIVRRCKGCNVAVQIVSSSGGLSSPVLERALRARLSRVETRYTTRTARSQDRLIPSGTSTSPLTVCVSGACAKAIRPATLPKITATAVIYRIGTALGVRTKALMSVGDSSDCYSLNAGLSS